MDFSFDSHFGYIESIVPIVLSVDFVEATATDSDKYCIQDLIGYFVEVFEESFEVQNKVDPRDMEANTLGQTFGRIIKKHKDVLPSQVMILKTLYHIRMNL